MMADAFGADYFDVSAVTGHDVAHAFDPEDVAKERNVEQRKAQDGALSLAKSGPPSESEDLPTPGCTSPRA
jgi:hypothetical protein